ncbi:uncharacterized protein LOC134875336 isoform X1 [Eleginops maclovinus]|uniref:uncharacterized protein LOC134875336 isoform X1 n=2 Tax=Eleginops maclovinus TaxID=56733 RepID=UPI003080444C
MQEYNMSVRSLYSTMTDDALDNEVRAIKSRLPHAGYQIVKGCLEAEGHHVQWTRLKASMHRLDTEGILSRMTSMGCVVRRKYCFQGPHFLQHIDTNHKLIRYNMVIFGGIDGYSRKIMYLNAGSNNTASTALQYFLDGVRRFGWPYKVRGDQGVENVSIAQMMFTVRGTGHGSFISGKSVHNQRIERLWRDVWTGVTHIYYDVLHNPEEDGSLDISDNLHLFCAQYTFLPRLKADLAKFSAGWNDHPIRTEGFFYYQLWELGMLQHPIREPEMSQENVAGLQIEHIDWESSVLSHDNSANPGVTVPEIECPLKTEDIEALCLAVDPLSHSISFGRDIYLTTLAHALYLLHHH